MSSILANWVYDGLMSTEHGSFGRWLWDEIVDRDWSKSDLARRVGVETSNVSRWINLGVIPSPPMCRSIAAALDLHPLTVLVKAGWLDPEDILIDVNDPLTSFAAVNQGVLSEKDKRMLIQMGKGLIAKDPE